MRNEASVEIDRPIEQVFDLTNRHVSDWSTVVVEDEVIEDKNDGGVGTKLRIVTEDRGRRMEFDGLVTAFERPTRSALTMVGKQFDIDAAYEFTDLGGRTRVSVVSNANGKGLTKVMFFLMGWMMKKSSCDTQNNELEHLKQFVESRP